MKSIKKSVRRGFDDSKSSKSFAKSIRSRRLAPQQAAIIENLQERLTTMEAAMEETKGLVDVWAEKNGPGWNLLCNNLPDWNEILEKMQREGGFVG